ncbi:MAG: 4Fe-4S binding protein [Candidatus Gastranaerophilales bacterium]|nr:4Fe-4S binding protein [Candidatus Gastranaerophilales bacterium]
MLKDLFETKQGFKLVCGAGNEDTDEIEKLVGIYSLAGCNFFDVCANPDVVDAAKRGLDKTTGQKDKYICVSVGIEGDPHITKAKINNDICINCQKCAKTCPHSAIVEKVDQVEINEKRCIGCAQCKEICPKNAIEIYTKIQNYDEILPSLISKKIDCIEFHAISKNEEDVLEKWDLLNKVFDGILCISVDRSTSGDKDLVNLVKKMVEKRKPFTTIIQADGVAMSGNNDEYSTTLQAVATAQMFQKANLEAYIMVSGGTNTKTMELAKLCGVHPNCIAVGSYARKIVKEYLEIDNLLENKEKLNEAVKIAKNLIDISLENMKND